MIALIVEFLYIYPWQKSCLIPLWNFLYFPGLFSLWVQWHPQIFADQLTLSQQRGADYAHAMILAII